VRRPLACLLAAVVLLGIAAPAALGQASGPPAPGQASVPPAEPSDDDCAAQHGIGAAACEVLDAAKDAAGSVARGVGGLAAEAGKGALGGLGFATDNEVEGLFRKTMVVVAKGSADALNSAKDHVLTSTRPDVGSEWFQRYYARMTVAVLPILAIFTLIGIAKARGLAGAWVGFARGLEAAALTATAAFFLTIALVVTDGATDLIAGSSATNTVSVFTTLGDKLVDLTRNGAIGTLVLGITVLLGFLGAALAWVNLAARGVGIEILTGLIPLVMALSVLHHFQGMRTKLITFLGGLVASLFIIVSIASLAINKLNAPDLGVTGVVQASAIVLSSVVLPWLLLGFIAGVAVDAAVGRAENLRNRATHAARTAKDNVHHKFVERFSKGEGGTSTRSGLTFRHNSLGMLGMDDATKGTSTASTQTVAASAVKEKLHPVESPAKPLGLPKVPDYWELPSRSTTAAGSRAAAGWGDRTVTLAGPGEAAPDDGRPPPRPVTPIKIN
jgi:hypothetical protein